MNSNIYIVIAFILLSVSFFGLVSPQWVPVLGAVIAIGFAAYHAGHQSGKDRAVRDNRNDLIR